MRILYAIQGTGNGHISRAMEIAPLLIKKAKTDLLISGNQCDLKLPYDVKYRFHGLSFTFGKRGGIDLFETYRNSKIRKLLSEIKQLPVEKYDLIISDFEPISCWAARKKGITCIGLSNQAAVMAQGAPQPRKFDPIGKLVLRNYAPCDYEYGFHFQKYNPQIYTPIIRKEIREADISNEGHYTVYLPSYDDERIIRRLNQFPDVHFEVFSKHSKEKYKKGNVRINPIEQEKFLKSFTSCEGIITGAGFGTPGEALFMRKKMLVIPMKQQYEQQCNAMALSEMGVKTIPSLKKKHLPKIEKFLNQKKIVRVDYPDETEKIIDTILKNHT